MVPIFLSRSALVISPSSFFALREGELRQLLSLLLLVTGRPRSHCATARGSNLTHVPTRNEGMRPAFACLKIVIRETDRTRASSSAVKAWPVFSIWSAILTKRLLETESPSAVKPRGFAAVLVFWPDVGRFKKVGVFPALSGQGPRCVSVQNISAV